jgi:U3 small nucleolar RNA-associated protein 11
MGKGRTGTVDGDRGNQVLSQDAVRLFKTQDLGYVRTMRNRTAKEVEELEMKGKGIKGEGKKIVFVDGEEEQNQRLDEDGNMEDTEDDEITPEERDFRKMQVRETEKLDNRLAVAKQRLKALTEAEQALEMQRAKMAKSTTVGGVTKAGVKFKARERKR